MLARDESQAPRRLTTSLLPSTLSRRRVAANNDVTAESFRMPSRLQRYLRHRYRPERARSNELHVLLRHRLTPPAPQL
jgi:hypothetical protein